MKKICSILVGASAILLALGLTACVSSDKKAADKPAATTAAAKPADAPAVLELTGFETETTGPDFFSSWHGGASTIAFDIATDQFHGGTKSLHFVSTQKDYCGLAIVLGEGKSDWSAYSALHFWMYGANSGKSFILYLEEDKKEQIVAATVTDDFTGWKEFVLPFAGFKSRTDYQASDAVVDRKFEPNVKTIQIGPGSGDSAFYLDDFSLTK
jgi:hypothetical protein